MAQTPNSAAEVSEERAASKQVGVLKALLPYFSPYKVWVVLALAALTITASVSLILPVAARRAIDGFSVWAVCFPNPYFLGAIAVAVVLAPGTRLRSPVVRRSFVGGGAVFRPPIQLRMSWVSHLLFAKCVSC